jgi:outer membrane receptor protein involved in Fe transport
VHKSKRPSGRHAAALGSIGGLALLTAECVLAPGARAQTTPAPSATAASEDQGGDNTVIVTGSHISTPGFTSPTPVSSVSAEDIKLAADLSVYDLENDIPALVPNSWTQQANANPGASNFNLRGLGINRTLTLIDGRRVAPTSYDGTVDVNLLPVSIIQRLDVVTGGASAAYGSDAIGGVVNVILDNKFSGIRANGQAGQSSFGDMRERDGSVVLGTDFDGGRGHVVFAGEVYRNSGGDQGQARRPWANSADGSGPALITNGNYVASGANGPKTIAVPCCATFSKITEGGVIDSGPLKGIYFGPGGTPNSMVYGPYAGSSTFMIGGSGGSFSRFAGVGPAVDRDTGYTHISYDLFSNLTVWSDLLFAHTRGESSVSPNYDNGTLTVNADNYYLPASIRSLAVADGVTNFLYGRENLELGINDPVSKYNDLRAEAGVNGKFAAFGSDWKWDATYQFSQNNYNYVAYNNHNQLNWANAIDVVASPVTGLPVCRSTLTHPNNGCVPVDIFGINTISAAGRDYIDGNSWNDYHQQVWDITGNVQGTPFSDWAGKVAVAGGFETRRDFINSSADIGSIQKVWRINNTQPFAGVQKVSEGYLETDIPLLRDVPFAQLASLNAACRVTSYSLSGTVETWKVGLDWAVNDDIRFRGTRSRDIRAPTLNDLFAGAGSQIGQITDRQTNTSYTFAYGTGGNPALTPEKSDTYTVGMVFSPTFVNGLQASLDYYHIAIANAISSPGIQGIEDDCELYGQHNLCQYISRDPVTHQITFIQNTEFNAASLVTNGVDLDIAYRLPASSLWDRLSGDFQVKLDMTYIGKLSTTNVGVATDLAGATTPHVHGNLRATYITADNKLTASVLLRYVGNTSYNKLYVDGVDINENEIASKVYTNFDLAYRFIDQLQVYGKVNNLFNVAPPLYTSGIIEPDWNSNNNYYDIIGRTFAVGFRLNL